MKDTRHFPLDAFLKIENETHCKALTVWADLKPCVMYNRFLIIKAPILLHWSFWIEGSANSTPSHPHHEYSIWLAEEGLRQIKLLRYFYYWLPRRGKGNTWQEKREINLTRYLEEDCKRFLVTELIICCWCRHWVWYHSTQEFLCVITGQGGQSIGIAWNSSGNRSIRHRERGIWFLPPSMTIFEELLCWQNVETCVLRSK